MPVRILHLDDDVRQTELLRMMLKRDNYEVISANDAPTALELAMTDHPDLILLDINIPRMNGLEFAARVKATPEIQHIPLVALTANTMYGDREYYLGQKFAAYLAKPVLRFELMRLLQSLLPPAVEPTSAVTPEQDTKSQT